MDIIDTILMSNQIEYSKVLLAWIGLDIDVNSENESSLLKLLVHLSEEAVYKLVDEDKDVIFNMNSVYIKLLENENSIIDIKDRKSTRLNSSHVAISYAVFCLKKKKIKISD